MERRRCYSGCRGGLNGISSLILSLVIIGCADIKESATPISSAVFQAQPVTMTVSKRYPDWETNPETSLLRPVQCAIIGDTLLVIDNRVPHVLVLSLSGEEIGSIGRHGHGPGELIGPRYAGIVPGKNVIWVADQGHISLFDREGNYLHRFRDTLGTRNVAVSPWGTFYLSAPSSTRRNQISVFDYEGNFIHDFGPGYPFLKSVAAEHFYGVSLLVWSPDGLWQMSEMFNYLRNYNYNGVLLTEHSLPVQVLIDNHEYNLSRSDNIGPGWDTYPFPLVVDIRQSFGLVWILMIRGSMKEPIGGMLLLAINSEGDVVSTYQIEEFVSSIDIYEYNAEYLAAIGISAKPGQILWLNADRD